jgi:predicted transport protein
MRSLAIKNVSTEAQGKWGRGDMRVRIETDRTGGGYA